MKLVKLLDLVGEDIAGQVADRRYRTADGTLLYDGIYKEPDSAYVRPLTRVYRKKRTADERRRNIGDTDWLYMEWEPGPMTDGAYDSGYGGSCGSAYISDWHVLVEA